MKANREKFKQFVTEQLKDYDEWREASPDGYAEIITNDAVKLFYQPIVSGSYYWVKLMTDDKHEPAMAINLLGVMNFQFFNGVAVPCDKVNDYSECNYR